MSPDAQAEALAKQRFFALGWMRLGGALVAIAGLLLLGNRIEIAGGGTDRAIGGVLFAAGLLGALILPVFASRRWKSPPVP